MTGDARKLINEVLRRHGLRCATHRECSTETLAAEIDKALGGLTRAWAAVLPDESYFGPYHEAHEICRNEARQQAEADVAEYEDATLKSRWVSGWSEAQP